MHYYQFNIGDYKSHTEHLSEMEDLAYRRLLDWYYLHETPIPLDIAETSRQIRMRSHSDCIANVLQEYFVRTSDGWMHGRADKEIAKTSEKSAKASESAKKRWVKDSKAMRTHSEGNATHNTRHITQDTNTKYTSTPIGFAEFWAAYPKRRNKGDAEKCWKRLKPDADLQARILKAVEVATRSDDWRKDGGQFIPYPASWLNAKGWEDQPTVTIQPIRRVAA